MWKPACRQAGVEMWGMWKYGGRHPTKAGQTAVDLVPAN